MAVSFQRVSVVWGYIPSYVWVYVPPVWSRFRDSEYLRRSVETVYGLRARQESSVLFCRHLPGLIQAIYG